MNKTTDILEYLKKEVQSDPDICGGVPVIKNTRFPLSRFLIELTDDQSISEIAENYELDYDQLIKIIRKLSSYFGRKK